MNLTKNFRFRKPEGTDPINVEDFNDNFDLIDEELKKRPADTDDISNTIVTFAQASERANVAPKESLAVLFGKIMRNFADLKKVAFSGSYKDLSEKPDLGTGAGAVVIESVDDLAAVTDEGYVVGGKAGAQLINNLGGCQFSQEGNDFYVIGADSVRKKLGSGLKLLHIRYVVGASNYSPYGSINVQFLNESATYLAQSNATVYGYAGSGTPSFDGSSSPWAVTVPAGWEAVTGTDISKYRYIWITYGWSTSVTKVVSDFAVK